MNCSPPVSSVHKILQARILEWVAIYFSRVSSQPWSPALKADSLPAELQGKPLGLWSYANMEYAHFPYSLPDSIPSRYWVGETLKRGLYVRITVLKRSCKTLSLIRDTMYRCVWKRNWVCLGACMYGVGLSDGSVVKAACQYRKHGFDSRVGEIPWRRKWQPTLVFLPGKLHGRKGLVGYTPGGCKELDKT